MLADGMARLSRAEHRIIWANSLKDSEGFEPLTRGMQAAMPHVKEFVSGRSLEALEGLVEVMSQ